MLHSVGKIITIATGADNRKRNLNTPMDSSSTLSISLPKIINVGGSTRVPARRLKSQEGELTLTQRMGKGLGSGPSCIQPIDTLRSPLAKILWQQARKPQSQQKAASMKAIRNEKGLRQILDVKRNPVCQKLKSIARAQKAVGLQQVSSPGLVNVMIPSLIMGYFLWDHIDAAQIYQQCQQYAENSLENLQAVATDFKEIVQSSDPSSSLERSEVANDLLDTAEKADIQKQAASSATMPQDGTPNKLAVWIAGALLAAAIIAVKKGSREL